MNRWGIGKVRVDFSKELDIPQINQLPKTEQLGTSYLAKSLVVIITNRLSIISYHKIS